MSVEQMVAVTEALTQVFQCEDSVAHCAISCPNRKYIMNMGVYQLTEVTVCTLEV